MTSSINLLKRYESLCVGNPIISYHVLSASGAGSSGSQHRFTGVIDKAPEMLAQFCRVRAHCRMRTELQHTLRSRVKRHTCTISALALVHDGQETDFPGTRFA